MIQTFVENLHSTLRKHRHMISAIVHSSYFTWKMAKIKITHGHRGWFWSKNWVLRWN